MEKKLYRDEHRKTIGGVCAGLADYFGMDVTIVRLLFVVLCFVKGVTLLPYIILWIVLPKRNSLLENGFNKPGYNPNFTAPDFNKPGYNPNFTTPGYRPGVDYSVPLPPAPGQPFVVTPKKSSGAGVVFGVVLIVLGSLFLLDQFSFIPDLDFDNLWPVILVAIGATLIFSGQKKQPWEKENWKETVANEPAATSADDTEWRAAEKKDDQSNENPTTI